MGVVYRGIQESLHRPVAIKILPAEMASDADFMARFQREAPASGHQQTVWLVTDLGRARGSWALDSRSSGQEWIRTTEGVSQRIYSPPRLATSVPTRC